MSSHTTWENQVKGVFNAFIDLERKAGELASDLFNAAKLAVEELGLKDGRGKFLALCTELETNHEGDLPRAWKVRKSELNRGLKLNLDPNKYASFTKYRDATSEKAGGGKSDTPKGYTPHDNTGGVDGGSISKAKVALVSSAMPSKAQERLSNITKELAELFEKNEGQGYAALKVFESTVHSKIAKLGGRFANVKNTGS